jgi:glycosyltransferase involved in cell wall biosynthesis
MKRWRWLRQQLRHTSAVSRDLGRKAALGERVDALTRKAPARQTEAIAVAEGARRLEAAEAGLRDSNDRLAAAEAALAAVTAEMETLRAAATAGASSVMSTDRSVVPQPVLDLLWAANAPLAAHPVITVVLATAYPDRETLLRSAIDSVLAQSYANWRLVVVDDSPTGYLASRPEWWPADNRVSVIRGPRKGSGSARQLALDLTDTELIAYLDDDCRWYPWWLHAVAAAFSGDQLLDAAYGIRIVEGSEAPWAHADNVDRLTLLTRNPVDTNVFAHRRTVAASLWQTENAACADYVTVAQLADRRWTYIPVPAVAYGERAPHRDWGADRVTVSLKSRATVQAAIRRAQPMRVLAHNTFYPQLSESYIGDEIELLRRQGVHVAVSRDDQPSYRSPSSVQADHFESLEEGVARFQPDVVLLHWATTALGARDRCRTAGVPYAVRRHSFDRYISSAELIDDLCVGVWSFATWADPHPLVHQLDTLILDPPSLSERHRERTLLSVSALLVKKGLPMLIGAAEQLDGVALDVIVALTNGHEGLLEPLQTLAAESPTAISVRHDVPFVEVQQAVARAGACVYHVVPGSQFGQPRSMIEAALAGTPLVVPESIEMRDLVGETAHYFELGNQESLVAACRAALDHPFPVEQRRALSDRVRARHGDPAAAAKWADELTAAVERWHRLHRTDRDADNQRWWWPG